MKVKIDIECTPEEARQFMGLPDLTPMQNEWMQKMQSLSGGAGTQDFFEMWAQMGMQGMEQWQKFVAMAEDHKNKK